MKSRQDAATPFAHGDTPGALDLAKAIRQEIELTGGRIVPVSRLLEEAAGRLKA